MEWNSLKKLTGSLFLKHLISTLISVLTPLNFFKETCPLYFHMCRQSGQNQANMRSSVLKLKYPLRNTCSGQKKLSYLTPIVWNSLPRPIIVNYSFIVTRMHYKNLPQNAAWRLIIWSRMEKKNFFPNYCKKHRFQEYTDHWSR